MNAGSTITSRDSHEVRHMVAARQARSGRPRWRNEQPRPTTSIAGGDGEHRRGEARADRQAAERGEGEGDDEALRRPGEGREEDDGEGRIHVASVGSGRRLPQRAPARPRLR